jgi:hypothetical protein
MNDHLLGLPIDLLLTIKRCSEQSESSFSVMVKSWYNNDSNET